LVRVATLATRPLNILYRASLAVLMSSYEIAGAKGHRDWERPKEGRYVRGRHWDLTAAAAPIYRFAV
jgi:hypothetical protein